jgi:cell division septum initiation protein DivIVA
MTLQIRSILLYNREGAVRQLAFELGAVNIITGRSLTGKSAIIEIIDYCLGRSDFTVPEGTIRDSVAWYGVLFRVGDSTEAFVAKPAPAPLAGSQSQCHFEIGSALRIPPLGELKLTSNDEAVAKALSRRIGITPNVHIPPPGATRRELEADIRHTTYYLFQDQWLIASKELLFHRQSEEYMPQTIKDSLPYFLGVMNPERVKLEQELRLARRRLKLAERDLREAESITVDRQNRGQALVAEAQQAGVLPGDAPITATEDVLAALNRAVRWVPTAAPAVERQRTAELRNQLEGQRDSFKSLQARIEAAETFERQAARYQSEAGEQVWRLQSIGIFRSLDGPHSCPVCSSQLAESFPSVVALAESLRQLDAELTFVERGQPRLREFIDGLKRDREATRQLISQTEFALEASVAEEEAARQMRDTNVRAARVVGRISLYLETIEAVDESSSLAAAASRASAEVRRLEQLLSEDTEEQLLTSVLNRIGSYMSRSAEDLQLEFGRWPYRLNLLQLTVRADRPGRPIPMQRMGGGKNWLGCHLILLLALHRHFVEEQRPVPGFLILDQPSQVYFPTLEDYKRLTGTTEDTARSGGDLEAVQRMFDLIFGICQRLAPNLQVIVLEHANLPDERYQKALVEPVWDGTGDRALVPESWKISAL